MPRRAAAQFTAVSLFGQRGTKWRDGAGPIGNCSGRSDPNNFDGLRLIASLLVVVSHTFLLSDRHVPTFYGSHTLGNLGVLIFFSISGYLIAASWAADPNPFRFLMRRSLRLVPGVIVACLTMYAFTAVSGFPSNHGHPTFNSPLWTLPYEACCYVVFMLFGIGSRSPALLMAGTFLGAWVMRGEVIGPWPDAVVTAPILNYFGMFFCAGALLFRYPTLRGANGLLAMLVAGVCLLRPNRDVLGLTLIVAPVVIAVGVRSWPVLRRAARCGDLSYGIYIYAWPVQQLLICWLGKETNYFVLIVPTLALTIGLAYLSWRWVESAALRLKPRATDPTSALPKPQVAVG